MLYFLGLNGPPGSGKDTLAEVLMKDEWFNDRFEMVHAKFSASLKSATHFLLGGEYTEEDKDQPSPYGPTWRELYIGMSEKFVKPFCGEEAFGKIMVTHLHKLVERAAAHMDKPILVVCSDCGFELEQKPLLEYMTLNQRAYIRLHREGKDFANDSRSYLYLDNCWIGDFYNNKPLHESAPEFLESVKQIAQRLAWTHVMTVNTGKRQS